LPWLPDPFCCLDDQVQHTTKPTSKLSTRWGFTPKKLSTKRGPKILVSNLLGTVYIVAGKGLFISPKRVQKEFIIVVLADRKRGFLTFF